METAGRIRSMTGIGRFAQHNMIYEVVCEIRSVNHKGLEQKWTLPSILSSMEMQLAKLVRSALRRGRIEIIVEVKSLDGGFKELLFDEDKANRLVLHLREFAKKNESVEKVISIGDLLNVPFLFSWSEKKADKGLLALVETVVSRALKDLLKQRKREGKQLFLLLGECLDKCQNILASVKKLVENSSLQNFEALRKRTMTLLAESQFESAKLAQELAFMVQRADVNEELSRLAIHVEHLRELMNEDEAVGRKLDFLCQEMMREANTAGSKIMDTKATMFIVDLKAEIEKVREQVQNIE